jgi:hypothetical protein
VGLARRASGPVISALLACGIGIGVSHSPAHAQAAPPLPTNVHTALYRFAGRHWQPTTVLRSNDRALFVVLGRFHHSAWSRPSGRLIISKFRGPEFLVPIIFRGRLRRHGLANGFTRLSLGVRVTGNRWLGRDVAQFRITNAHGQTFAIGLPFTVRRFSRDGIR